MHEPTPIFHQQYLGPKGPHLSCLTSTSLFGYYKPELQHSIHPRVVDGAARYPKSNTAEPRRERGK